MDISQSIEYIMEGKYYQRGSRRIKKDVNSQINSASSIDEEITISMTSYKTSHITTSNNIKKDIRQNIPWLTKNYLDNGSDKRQWRKVLPTKESS